MATLTREEILGMEDRKVEVLKVKAWGGKIVSIRPMTGHCREEIEVLMMSEAGDDRTKNWMNLRAKVIVRSVCDDKGELLFTEADVAALSGKHCAALDEMWVKARAISKLDADDVKALTKNSESAPGG